MFARVDVQVYQGGATVASGTLSTGIIGPLELHSRVTKSITLWNCGTNGVQLSGAQIQINPDPTVGSQAMQRANPATPDRVPHAAMWHRYADFPPIGSGECRTVICNDLARHWRVVGTATQGSFPPTVSGYVSAASL